MIDDSSKAGAAKTVLGVLGGLAVVGGVLVTIYARAPAPTDVLVHSTVLVYDPALAQLGVQVVTRPDGGQAAADLSSVLGGDGGFTAILAHGGQPIGSGATYWRVDICTPVVDGGADPGPSFLGTAAVVIYDDQQTDLCRDGGPVIEAWQQGRADAPLPCACAVPDSGVLAMGDGGPVLAPVGVTLQPGQWLTDAGTVIAKACVELAGRSSWDARCGP